VKLASSLTKLSGEKITQCRECDEKAEQLEYPENFSGYTECET